MKTIVTTLLTLLCLQFAGFSQNNNEVQDPTLRQNQQNRNEEEIGDRASNNRFWEANLSGGNYMVALDRISSVSRHKYVLDGAVIVDEVTIDTVGQAIARFYFITPITSGAPGTGISQLAERAIEVVDGAARTAGSEIQNMVVKKYPVTTHARTIEYRLLTEAQLTGLYTSVRTAWQTGKGRQFTGL